MSGESLLVILLIGLIAGWLAGTIMTGWGFGLVGNIGIGVIGALIASWLLALSRWRSIGATNPAFNRDHAAAVTLRHVCMAEARNARCVFAETRWRWTLKVL